MSTNKTRGGGSAQWTTAEQLAYLKSQVPAYQAAQTRRGKKFSDFWATVFEYWFQHWPPDKLTDEDKENDITEENKADSLKTVSY
jgi:hypothetical protein